ncbi:hypothetical protein NLJ89_g1065 [Agrocybe chaxingu]|uniref:Uncharacterized protein n=1 Tax=Agrocybe chaxingu TaxID=84603 RepID=A0A9W8TDY0_9AGAR|nr:hypothetical protein NLJ89_g1065 [Agrocybe chaxingu]
MTRSTHKALSRREAFTKSVRAKAHAEGILFSTALTKMNPINTGTKENYIHQSTRRNPGRNGSNWANDNTVRVDDEDLLVQISEDDVYDYKVDCGDAVPTKPEEVHFEVDLLVIARPAKKKGPAKDFEVVKHLPGVIALDEDHWESSEFCFSEEDWEAIYDDERADQRTYSAVLRGNEG